ncbi:hypothetical protein DXC69_00855 [Paenibacillus polymyxa]|nr:hypothetical protein DXC69_00855 [Paenibacillus polymyxa]
MVRFFSLVVLLITWIMGWYANVDYLVVQRDASNGGEYKELYISSRSIIPPLVVGKQYYFVSDQRYFQHPYIRYVEE